MARVFIYLYYIHVAEMKLHETILRGSYICCGYYCLSDVHWQQTIYSLFIIIKLYFCVFLVAILNFGHSEPVVSIHLTWLYKGFLLHIWDSAVMGL